MTIDQIVQWAWIALLVLGPPAIWLGLRRVSAAGKLRFYLLRRQRAVAGWRFILMGIASLLAAVAVFRFGRQAAYLVVRPTPSITPIPTVTQTPSPTLTLTITITPSISLTPSITRTPTASVTPRLPERLEIFFQETITPRADVLISPILVAESLTPGNLAVDPEEEFEGPPDTLYGAFTYDNFDNGVRWTALWYFGEEIICYESEPWDGGTGGYVFT
ncbi:MAG TPA: hypothetical protein VFI11_00675 [Anaerolineales bacterium]|nr:hypothetical protein [Anaerolineales bacterium]